MVLATTTTNLLSNLGSYGWAGIGLLGVLIYVLWRFVFRGSK